MVTKLSWKKFSQATATTALGISMLVSVGTAKASAVTLQTFKVSGTFGDKSFVYGKKSYPYPSDRATSNFINGSFDGTFTVDVEQLPTATNYVNLETSDIKLRNSSGGVVRTVSNLNSNSEPYFGSVEPEQVHFYTNDYTLFDLFVNNNFTGTSSGRPVDVGLGVPVYGRYEDYVDRYEFGSGIYVTSFRSEPVPEPFTLGGTAVAGTMGWWLRRKRKASQAV